MLSGGCTKKILNSSWQLSYRHVGTIKKQHFPFSVRWWLGQTLSYPSQHYQQHFSSLALPKHQSCPISLIHYKFAAGVSSTLPLAPFLQGFLLVQNSLCLEGLQARILMRRCHFSALHGAKQAPGRHRSAFHASLAKKLSGGTSLGRQKRCVCHWDVSYF